MPAIVPRIFATVLSTLLLLGLGGEIPRRPRPSGAAVTFCNADLEARQEPLTFAANGSTCTAPLGTCCEVAGQAPGTTLAVSLVAPAGQLPLGSLRVLSASARNYGMAYRSAEGLRWLAPSAQFSEALPEGWARYTWANLCGACGDVSAYVNGYRKQINAGPMRCGAAFDETEGPPGPPQGAAGVFTAFRPQGEAPGPVVANVTFPWSRAQFEGREPFQALLAPGVTLSYVFGQPAVLRGASGAQGSRALVV
mmetsp:Transcript_58478/g.187844  ORF Transcript_58478/g.187844 Transcript_58478/m.187844 type:complete len:252 (-) Transcript_58478:78-833(-)